MFRLPLFIEKWWPKKGFTWEDIDSIPNCIGVYELLDDEEIVLYVGKSSDLCTRLFQHYYVSDVPRVRSFRCYQVSKMKHANDFEKELILDKLPAYNIHGKR